MDEIKSKLLDLIHKQVGDDRCPLTIYTFFTFVNLWSLPVAQQDRHLKIPSMGFTDYYAAQTSAQPDKEAAALDAATKRAKEETAHTDGFRRLPDQEILDGLEPIYYAEDANCEQYELMVSVRIQKKS